MGIKNKLGDLSNHLFAQLEYINYAQNLGEELNKKEIVLNDILKPLFELDWKKSKCVNLHMAEQKQ